MRLTIIPPSDLRPKMLALGTVNHQGHITPYPMALAIVDIHQVTEPAVGLVLEFAHHQHSDVYASWGAGSVLFAVLDGWLPPEATTIDPAITELLHGNPWDTKNAS